jgi:NTP pyrophosphatase (non-canonical NTP hydrolase)
MDMNEMQKEAWANKVNKGFNTTNVEKEFCLLTSEVGEAYMAYLRNKDELGSELADIAIYLFGLSEMLGLNLKDEIEKKMEINRNRKYKLNEYGVLIKDEKKD